MRTFKRGLDRFAFQSDKNLVGLFLFFNLWRIKQDYGQATGLIFYELEEKNIAITLEIV